LSLHIKAEDDGAMEKRRRKKKRRNYSNFSGLKFTSKNLMC
jgi:hypothetical protein